MAEHPSIASLKELIGLLRQPLEPIDLAGGWTVRAQEAAVKIAEDAIQEIRQEKPCYASRHFVRWLDHMGVVEGPLFNRVAKSQVLIPRAQPGVQADRAEKPGPSA